MSYNDRLQNKMVRTSGSLRRDVIILVQLLQLASIGPETADVIPSSLRILGCPRFLQVTVSCYSDARDSAVVRSDVVW